MIDKDNIELIELDLTTICNAKCPLCYRNSKQFNIKYRRPFFRTYEEIISQIDSFVNLKSIYLIGQLSEPTTHLRFLDIVRHSKNRNLRVKICTNGDLHEDEYWKQLGEILDDNDEVWFTICGSTQELHHRYRVNTSLNKILRHAKTVRQIRHVDCVKCIRFNYNSSDIDSDKFKEMVKDFSQIEYIDTSYPSEQDYYNDNFNYVDFLPIEKIQVQYKKVESYVKMCSNLKDNHIYCQSIEDNSLQIDAFGNIYPCYRFLEYNNKDKWNENYGDILKGKCECCKFCNHRIVEYCGRNNMNSII